MFMPVRNKVDNKVYNVTLKLNVINYIVGACYHFTKTLQICLLLDRIVIETEQLENFQEIIIYKCYINIIKI